eukprot:1499532-Rhodomonas_salina.4
MILSRSVGGICDLEQGCGVSAWSASELVEGQTPLPLPAMALGLTVQGMHCKIGGCKDQSSEGKFRTDGRERERERERRLIDLGLAQHEQGRVGAQACSRTYAQFLRRVSAQRPRPEQDALFSSAQQVQTHVHTLCTAVPSPNG